MGKTMPRKFPHVMRALLPQLAQVAVFYSLAYFTEEIFWVYISVGFGIGFTFGAIINFTAGMKTSDEIMRNVYGQKWRLDVVIGSYYRRKLEEMQRN